MTTARRLIADVDRLADGRRKHELARLARRTAGTRELTDLLADLHGHGRYGRLTALTLAGVAGDLDHVARCLTATETEVVGRALGLAVRLGLPAARLVERLPELSTELRRRLYRVVRRRHARTAAEALLAPARARFGDAEAAVLLPVCGPATVAEALPDLAYAVTGWRMLGHEHPGPFLDWFDAELDATPATGWATLVERVAAGLVTAAPAEPARVLAALARVAPRAGLPGTLGRAWTVLARHDPGGVLELLVDPNLRARSLPTGRRLLTTLATNSDDDLVRLCRNLDQTSVERVLRRLPQPRRAAVHARTVANRDVPSLDALDLLPAGDRAAEATRLLGLRVVADDPVRRLAVTARLPWALASTTLREATRRPTAAERAEAYRHLVTAVTLHRDQDVLGELLGTLGERLANEQDPVREAALRALTEVPPGLFRSSDAPALLTLLTDALRARDASWQTQHHVRTLVTRLVRHGALTGLPRLVETGIDALRLLGTQRPWLDLHGLDRDLPRGGEHQVFAALLPRITEDARRGRFEVALSLAGGLGRRAWDMPELQRFVDRARRASDDQTVRTAIELWLAPPATRDERIAEVYRADRSTITIHAVLFGIALRRTDLVDEVLAKPSHGRFLPRSAKYVPAFVGCFHRWTPRQCTAYADLLARVADRRSNPVWERAGAVGRLGRVPDTAQRLRGYLDDAEVTVAEAALGALVWTDEPALALAPLLEHVDTDRARVAVYAATRGARFVAPARLAEALEPALRSWKVTAQKEALRLLAAHHAPDVAAVLAGAWARPDQHRDVRRAIVWAAGRCLDDERVWPVLESAAAGGDAVSASVLDLDPHRIAGRHRQRYAALVRTVAGAADPDLARLALATLPRWSGADGAGTALLVDRVCDLADTATWAGAVVALVDACDTAADPAPLVAAATRLLATAEPPAATDRDLPARQRLRFLARHVRAPRPTPSPTIRAAASGLATVLAGEPTLRRAAVELAISAVPLDGGDGDEAALARVAELAGGPALAWHAHDTLARTPALRWLGRLPPAHPYDLAAGLAGRDDAPAPHLLALALAAAAGGESGWPDHWRELVAALRTHPDTDVRTAALDTVTSRE